MDTSSASTLRLMLSTERSRRPRSLCLFTSRVDTWSLASSLDTDINNLHLINNFMLYTHCIIMEVYRQVTNSWNQVNQKSWAYGDWGLGIGDWGLGPIPNPQSPIPNPQSPIPNPQSAI